MPKELILKVRNKEISLIYEYLYEQNTWYGKPNLTLWKPQNGAKIWVDSIEQNYEVGSEMKSNTKKKTK